MLSNRMTAKSLELNPARQARKRMLNDSKDCQPAGCDSPPDRPPLPATVVAAAAGPARLLPCAGAEPPELVEALCFPSVAAWCSAISERGVGCLLAGRPSLPALRCLPPPLRNSRQNSSFASFVRGAAASRKNSAPPTTTTTASPPDVRIVLIQFPYSDGYPTDPETHTHAPHSEPANPRLASRLNAGRKGGGTRGGWVWRRTAPAAFQRLTSTRGRGLKRHSQSGMRTG